jgi:peptidoglycan/xylan/chitin deacetylase (PgdA/CDA1 family)
LEKHVVTNRLGGRLHRLWGAVAVALLLIAVGTAAAMDDYRQLTVPARAATNPDLKPTFESTAGARADALAQETKPGVALAEAGLASMNASPPPLADDPWSDTRRVAPYVEAIEPSGEAASVTSPIVARFSQPMARASVEKSFAISPPVHGDLVWLDEFTIRFQPLKFAHGQVYEVRMRGQSLRGVPLVRQGPWHFTTVSGPPLVLAPGPSAIRVPVLMYHYIRVNPNPYDRLGYNLSVTPADFATQMDWLARNGYHPITFAELHGYLNGQKGLPSRPVILTFDDGYADFYTTALPVLRAHDFNAVAYVVSGFVGRPGYMTAAQVVEADRSGIEIGAHTVDHADLAKQSPDGLRYQLTVSKNSLEQLLGHPVLSLCYPSGKFNSTVAAAAENAGYRDATTTRWGSFRSLAGRYIWDRLRISGGETLDQFARELASQS